MMEEEVEEGRRKKMRMMKRRMEKNKLYPFL
jgi:hypothetical protein